MRTACAFTRATSAILKLSACASALALLTCCAPPPGDFLLGPAYAEAEPPPPPATSLPKAPSITSAVVGFSRRVIAEAGTPALALDGTRVYYGNAIGGLLYATPKAGGNAVVAGPPAPLDIAAGDGTVAWIGNPGDTVYRIGRLGDTPAKVGEGRVFTSIATSRGEVIVTETAETHGLVRVLTGPTAGVLAELDAAPRSLAIDEASVFVVTAGTVVAVARAGGPPRRLLAGYELTRAALDREFVYTTAQLGGGRSLVRVPKGGGEMKTIVPAVRDAPIAVFAGYAYFLDPNSPAIRRVPRAGGVSSIVAYDDALGDVNALAVDDTGIYAGCDAKVLTFALPR